MNRNFGQVLHTAEEETMKIRNGFVSNSSSSSFTCDSCGHTASGWDLGLVDAMGTECENGHYICERHLEDENMLNPEFWTLEQAQKWWSGVVEFFAQDDREVPAEPPAEWFGDDEDEWEDLCGAMEDELRWGIPASWCPCCKMKEVGDDDMLSYLLLKVDMKRKDVAAEMRATYPNFKAFQDALLAFTNKK